MSGVERSKTFRKQRQGFRVFTQIPGIHIDKLCAKLPRFSEIEDRHAQRCFAQNEDPRITAILLSPCSCRLQDIQCRPELTQIEKRDALCASCKDVASESSSLVGT